jgi:hydrogenase nickel insertion protein HypA
MHEYAIVSELVAALLPQLERHDGRITAVHLNKGELRILSDTALCSAFEILTEGTRLAGAGLQIDVIPAGVRCHHCGYAGPPDHVDDGTFHDAIPILSCPTCGGIVEVVTGRELNADRVTMETEDHRRADDD